MHEEYEEVSVETLSLYRCQPEGDLIDPDLASPVSAQGKMV